MALKRKVATKWKGREPIEFKEEEIPEEEIKQRQEEGQAFIRKREEIAKELITAGASPVGAQRKAAQQITAETEAAQLAFLKSEEGKKLLQQQKALETQQITEQAQQTQQIIEQRPEEKLDLTKQAQAGIISTSLGLGGLTGGALGQAQRLITEPQEELGRIATGTVLGAAAGISIGGQAITLGLRALGLSAVLGKITYSQRKGVSEDYKKYTIAKDNILFSIAALNKQQTTYQDATIEYSKSIQSAIEVESKLKMKTQNILQNFLGAPKEELIEIENFLRPEIQEIYRAQLLQAYLNPNPNFDASFIEAQIKGISE